jgi:DNA invertase Pin-like site-specific DNA recombinase
MASRSTQKRCAIYARVSTREQRPRSQLRELTQYAKRKRYQLPYRPFVDVESAGKLRPNLEKLRELVRRRKVDVVLVWKFDRFARSLQELINSLEEFRELGIDFESYTQQIDTTTSHGKAWFGWCPSSPSSSVT